MHSLSQCQIPKRRRPHTPLTLWYLPLPYRYDNDHIPLSLWCILSLQPPPPPTRQRACSDLTRISLSPSCVTNEMNDQKSSNYLGAYYILPFTVKFLLHFWVCQSNCQINLLEAKYTYNFITENSHNLWRASILWLSAYTLCKSFYLFETNIPFLFIVIGLFDSFIFEFHLVSDLLNRMSFTRKSMWEFLSNSLKAICKFLKSDEENLNGI